MLGPIYIHNDDPHYYKIIYRDNGDPEKRVELESRWHKFDRQDPLNGKTYQILSRPTNHLTEVTVDRLLPPESSAGRYRLETYIPGKHATTRRAIFTVVH